MPKGQALGAKVVWDDAADKQFLMAMIKVGSPTLPNFDTVAASIGNGVTASALQNRWKKLKKQVEACGSDSGSHTPSKPKTPAKPKTTGSDKPAGKRKRDSTDDNDDAEVAATKSAVNEDKADVKKVKAEKVEDEEDDMDGMI